MSDRERTHDLRALLLALATPAHVQQSPRLHQRSPGTHALSAEIGIADWHEAWRYGVNLDPEDERLVEAWLEQVSEWLRHRFSL